MRLKKAMGFFQSPLMDLSLIFLKGFQSLDCQGRRAKRALTRKAENLSFARTNLSHIH